MNKKAITCFVVFAILVVVLEISLAPFLKEYYIHVIMLTTLLFLSGLFLIWHYHFRRFKKEIMNLIKFLDSIARGDFSQRLLSAEEGELGILTEHIVSMAEALKNRLEEAKKQLEIIENVLKNMKEGLLIINENGRVLLFNDSLKELLGIISRNGDITAAEILRDAGLLSLIEDSRLMNETISRDISLRNERYLQATSSPVQLSENEKGFIMTFYDITKLKRLEQMRRDFVANVAHEIRTPITAIKGFAETLLDGAIEDKENAIRFLDIIKRHSERLNSLVNDLLTLSAIEQGEIKIEKADVNLSETIDALFALMGDKARSKGLYLKKALPEDMPSIKADRDRLFQILLNLIDNAIKFTDLGGVTVGAEKVEERIILFVEDTGCGIEKKHLSRLGERFYRVDRARSRELGGTGLGLAIVKHLVKAHGWTMDIGSTPGKGTKVKIIIG
ncbi:MAG: sensor histidine kinase [Thermodesulfovibrionales bacterium]